MFGIGSSGSLGMGVVMSLQDDFTGSAQTIEKSMQKLEGMTDAMTERVTRGLGMMKKGLQTFAVGVALSAPFIMAIDKAADFEQAMSNIKAVTGATAQEMTGFKTLALNTGKDIGFGAMQTAEGIELLAKAGISLETIAKGGLRGALTLAKAGELSVGEAAEIASSALFAFSKDNLTVAKSADILAGAANASRADVKGLSMGLSQVGAVAAAVGQSFETTTVALAAFAQKGLIGSDAGTSLKTMLNNLQPVGLRETEMFEKLGWVQTQMVNTGKGVKKMAIENSNIFYDQTGKMKNLYEISNILKSTTAGLTDQQRQFAFQTIFGSDAIRASLIMYQLGADGLENVHKEMSKVTAEMVAQEKMNNLSGEWKKFTANMETLAITVGDMFLPVLRSATTLLTSFVKGFTWFAGTMFGGAILKVIAAAGAILMLGGAFMMIKGAIVALSAMMPAFIASLWAAMAPLLPLIAALAAVAAGVYFLKKSYDSYLDVLEGREKVANGFLGFMQRTGAAISTVMQVWNSWNGKTFDLGGNEAELQAMGILEQMKALATWVVRVKEFIGGFVDGLTDMFGFLKGQWTGFKRDIGSIFDYLGINLGKLGIKLDTIRTVAKGLAYLVAGPLVAALTALRWIITGVVLVLSGVSALLYGIYDIGKWAIGGLIDWFNSWNLGDWISGMWDTLKTIGSNIVSGIFEGIRSGWDAITAWIQEKMSILANLNPFSSTSGNISAMQLQPVAGGAANLTQQRAQIIQNMRSQPGNSYVTTKHYSTSGPQTAQVDLHIDGDKIGRAVVDFQNRNDSEQ